MGFASRSCSFTRFKIIDPVSEELLAQIILKLQQAAFRDIDDTLEMEAHGWVNFENMLDSEWSSTPPQKGAYIVFSLRQDLRRIPVAVIKKHLSLALIDEKNRISEQGKKFISRERKKEIKEQVLLRLRSRFLPIPGEFNVLWATTKNEVWFASTQSKMIDLFMEHFFNTFDLHLEQMTPYNLANSMLGEDAQVQLDKLEATQFTITS